MTQRAELEDEFAVEQRPLDAPDLATADGPESRVAADAVLPHLDRQVVQRRALWPPQLGRVDGELELRVGRSLARPDLGAGSVRDLDLDLGGRPVDAAVGLDGDLAVAAGRHVELRDAPGRRHRLEPDGLPDARAGAVEDVRGPHRLLADGRKRALPVGRVAHPHGQEVVGAVGGQRVGDVDAVAKVATDVPGQLLAVDEDAALVVDGLKPSGTENRRANHMYSASSSCRPESPLSTQLGIMVSMSSRPDGGGDALLLESVLRNVQMPLSVCQSARLSSGRGCSGHGFVPSLYVQSVSSGGFLTSYFTGPCCRLSSSMGLCG
ncbi:uncharacterized protein PpBr36_10237 [Pyricularia pennisetigena]|uniref:uncharacterized protein n=1 Tax=Pyricularia pennisetigena TaxID=1578925 RepID=UPI00114E82EF|nr:uncharacterized protein PpBr36_10237 [Pyricularia pennisetigena]TLS21358.1 hypothetical protein PpBr36_10237 [Pyricularia pennisetigena]